MNELAKNIIYGTLAMGVIFIPLVFSAFVASLWYEKSYFYASIWSVIWMVFASTVWIAFTHKVQP